MALCASTVVIDDGQRERLWALTRSRTAPYREVERASVVLAAAEGGVQCRDRPPVIDQPGHGTNLASSVHRRGGGRAG